MNVEKLDPVRIQEMATEIVRLSRQLSDNDLELAAALKCAAEGYQHTVAVGAILAATQEAMK